MSIKSFCAAFSALAFVVVVSASSARAENPIPGIDVVVKKKPASSAIAKGTTDAKGEVTFKDLAPGQYTVVLDPKAADAAKLHGAGWLVALVAVANPVRPVTYTPKPGASEVDIVIPEGPAQSYKARVWLPPMPSTGGQQKR